MKKKNFLKNVLCVLKKVVFLQPQIQRGAVAQLVEQRTENPCVTGSTPVSATPSKGSRKWSFFCCRDTAHPLNRHHTVGCIFSQIVHRCHRNVHPADLPPILSDWLRIHTSF